MRFGAGALAAPSHVRVCPMTCGRREDAREVGLALKYDSRVDKVAVVKLGR